MARKLKPVDYRPFYVYYQAAPALDDGAHRANLIQVKVDGKPLLILARTGEEAMAIARDRGFVANPIVCDPELDPATLKEWV